MPHANAFHTDGPRFPLHLMACRECSHGQLSAVVSGLFTDYPYLSGVSRTFKEHCRGLVSETLPARSVLDLGCNDCTLLSLFREAGCEVLGVDPAANLREYANGIPVVNAFWGVECARPLGRKFDLITAQNVFAHCHDLDDFLAGCDAALEDDGRVAIEFPYAPDMIARNEFDTCYHEHLNYFTARSFARLISRSAFYIADAQRFPIHGGSVRMTLRRKPGQNGPAVEAMIGDERLDYAGFRGRVEANRKAFRALIADRRGEKVVGYCASAKGSVMLNHFGVWLDYVVDDTPLKQGGRIPGTSIPVVGPDVLRAEPGPVSIVVLAWNWLEEIRARVRSLRGARDRLLLYVPEVTVEAA